MRRRRSWHVHSRLGWRTCYDNYSHISFYPFRRSNSAFALFEDIVYGSSGVPTNCYRKGRLDALKATVHHHLLLLKPSICRPFSFPPTDQLHYHHPLVMMTWRNCVLQSPLSKWSISGSWRACREDKGFSTHSPTLAYRDHLSTCPARLSAIYIQKPP